MELAPLIGRLRAGGQALLGSLAGATPEQAGWKPSANEWSLIEVAAHLVDEEREDFRVRLRLVLENEERSWPSIDPQGWVTARDYASRDLGATVRELAAERSRSVAWLETLDSPDWERTYEHPLLGPLRAGDLLVSWVTHDALHLRQLARLHYRWVVRLGSPYEPDYAGPW